MFYAIGRNRIPVIVSVATVAVNAALNFWLVQVMGYRGLALGTSIAALFNAGTLLVLLRSQLRGLNSGRICSSVSRIALASIAMGVAAFAVASRAGVVAARRERSDLQIVRLALTIGVALAVLAGSRMAAPHP